MSGIQTVIISKGVLYCEYIVLLYVIFPVSQSHEMNNPQTRYGVFILNLVRYHNNFT